MVAKTRVFARFLRAARVFAAVRKNVCRLLAADYAKTRLVTVARGPVPARFQHPAAARNRDVLSYPAWRGTGPRPNGSRSGALALQAIRPGEGQALALR